MPKDQSFVDDDFSFSSDDDSDAPAEVRTSSVRSKKLSQVRDFQKRDKEAKAVEKDKRRKRDDMYKTQKEQKLLKFGKRALPEDVLEAVSAKNAKMTEETDEGIDLKKNLDDGEEDNDRLSGDNFSDEDGDDDAKHDSSFGDDFISLNQDSEKKGLNVVTLEAPKKNKSSLEKALAFKNNQLYHKPGTASKRQTANQCKNYKLKIKQLRG